MPETAVVPYLSIPDAAKHYGVGRTFMYALIRDGLIETTSVGGGRKRPDGSVRASRRLVCTDSANAYFDSCRSRGINTRKSTDTDSAA